MPVRRTRRSFLKRLALAGLAGPTLLASRAARTVGAATGDRPPNVLFIAVDDLNDWVGCLGGHPDTKTPHIDRLAARGQVFTNAMCPGPACIPSRTALMTGMAPARSGVYTNFAGFFRQHAHLKDVVTLPQHFRAHGYEALGTGKVFHHHDAASWDAYGTVTYWENPTPDGYKESNGDRTREWVPLDVPNEQMTDWGIADWAIRHLKRDHAKPFFLACGFYRPHEPWFVPQAYHDRFDLESLHLPRIKADDLEDLDPRRAHKQRTALKCVADPALHRRGVRSYLASIAFADDCVGRVLDALDASPHRDHTIVFLWSDHGFHLGEKFHWSKFTLWEESARCVLICDVPGVTRPGARCDEPVNLQDMYPTLADLCGLPRRADLDGTSFLPQLKDPAAARRRPSITANDQGSFSLRFKEWRYIHYRNGAEELYHHKKDPMEWDNLAGRPEHRDRIKRFAAFLPNDPAPALDVRKKNR